MQTESGAGDSKRWLWLALKLAVTVSAFAYLIARQPRTELFAALRELSPRAVVMAVLIQLAGITIGAVRWRLLLRAYGADMLPGLSELIRVYLIGFFYNTYVPGGIGGDVVRGVVTRNAFHENPTTRAMAVVFVERALGLAGMLALTIVAAAVFLRERFAAYLPLLGLAFAGVCALVFGIAVARRLAPWTPAPLRALLEGLPLLVGHGAFASAALLSLLTHTVVALSGHVLMDAVYPAASLLDSLVAMPLAGAAGYFPLSVAGAGAREYVLVEMYMALGIPKAAGTATAFAFLFAILVTGSLGGLLQLVSPMTVSKRANLPASKTSKRPGPRASETSKRAGPRASETSKRAGPRASETPTADE